MSGSRRDPFGAVFLLDVVALAVASLITGPRLEHALAGLLLVLLFATGGLYRMRLHLSVLDAMPATIGRAVLAGALTGSMLIVAFPQRSGAHLFAFILLALVLLLTLRTVAWTAIRALRRSGRLTRRTLIIGAGLVGGQLCTTLQEHREYGLLPVGMLDPHPLPAADCSVPVLGGSTALAGAIRSMRADVVIVAFTSLPESEMVEVLRTCDRLQVEILVVPRFFEMHGDGPDVDEVWGIPLVWLHRSAHRSWRWRMKRVFDAVVAGSLLLITAPVMLACALGVRFECGLRAGLRRHRPSILFRQERIGLDGKPFVLLKFRSLLPADEADDAAAREVWSVAGDDRVTWVGRMLRRTSLDELPQLWNVLRGQMSLVGPRPERPSYVAEFTQAHPGYVARHRVPAGLTGWAQVHGLRGDTSISDRARFDNRYIEHWSLWGDIKILLRTIGCVVRGSGS